MTPVPMNTIATAMIIRSIVSQSRYASHGLVLPDLHFVPD